MTNEQAVNVVNRILASYPTQRQRMTPEDVEAMTLAYITGIRDLDCEAVLHAVDRVTRTAKWMPTIAEIREAVVDHTSGSRRTGAEAWGDVLRLVRRYGAHRSPGTDFQIADPIVADVIRMFGWQNLCASDADGRMADRARFVDAYDQLARSARKETQIAHGARTALPDGSGSSGAPAQLVAGVAGSLTRGEEPS